jgi:hypothetical protein
MRRRACGSRPFLLTVLMLALALALARSQTAGAQGGALHTLTMSDNGSTLSLPMGDSVAVQLDGSFDWSVQVDHDGVLRRSPLALVQGVQAVFDAVAPGQAVISATGSVHCAPGMACPLLAVVWSATVVVTGTGGGAAMPVTHVLTSADNGASVNAAVGDSITLKLDPSLSWDVSLDNPAIVFRPPLALIMGVQAVDEIVAPGQATISATGLPPACRNANPPCGAPAVLWSASVTVAGTLHSLTQSDNGTTVNVAAGDYVRLDVAPLQPQNALSSDTTVLAPVAIDLYHQPLFRAVGSGQATLSATLNPACYPACKIASLAFSATIAVQGQSGTGGSPSQIALAAGWNLVAGSDGTTLPVDAFRWNPALNRYDVVPAGQPLQAGAGYWAFASGATVVPLAQSAANAATVSAPAGLWVMVGDPTQGTSATVQGADALFTWDPLAQKYVAATLLQPGQGAWALSYAGGTITIQGAATQ